jgi:translation initiation factor 1
MCRRVYTTEQGRLCPSCQSPSAQCQCRQQHSTQGDGKVRISYETKGRKGKGITYITGIPLPSDELKQLLKQLQQKISTGGSIKHGQLQLQGDQRERVRQLLHPYGWTIKLVR